jgi:hypothetical protein
MLIVLFVYLVSFSKIINVLLANISFLFVNNVTKMYVLNVLIHIFLRIKSCALAANNIFKNAFLAINNHAQDAIKPIIYSKTLANNARWLLEDAKNVNQIMIVYYAKITLISYKMANVQHALCSILNAKLVLEETNV